MNLVSLAEVRATGKTSVTAAAQIPTNGSNDSKTEFDETYRISKSSTVEKNV